MNKLLLSIFLLTIPLLIQADLIEPSYTKSEAIKLSETHYHDAIKDLHKAQDICWYIPDLGKRKHLESIINGLLTSAVSKDAKTGLISAVLPIFTDLVTDAFDKYIKIITHIRNAEYHIEMAIFYNQLSLHPPNKKYLDERTLLFFKGIDYLTLAICIAESVHPKIGCVIEGSNIGYNLRYYRKKFIDCPLELAYEGEILYENLCEIMCECIHPFKSEIYECIKLMAIKFQEAENANFKPLNKKKKKK